jgi:hypothetical protein
MGTVMLPIKDGLSDLMLEHSDSEGNRHRIRISMDQSLEARHKGRVLGELWKLVEPHLSELPADVRPCNFKLGNSTGKLFVVVDNRPTELFATKLDDFGNLEVTPHERNLLKYTVSAETAASWAASASRSALRAGR